MQEDGSVLFRIWAPGTSEISVAHADRAHAEPMVPWKDGWFSLRTAGPGAGEGYYFQLPNGHRVPDPASRGQVEDVNGPSLVVDPRSYRWRNAEWQGRPWAETVIYELHIGTFSPEGTFEGVRQRLDHLAGLGITAIELMPIAAFSGDRGWGYDGVLPFAPDRSYGTPDELKHLIDDAHGLGLMMFLDVVYNHFGPVGNFLHEYASAFFDEERSTPWGAGIDFTKAPVRDYFIHNALYWLEEYRFDGLRFDAVDQIVDPSDEHLLEELASSVRTRIRDRHVHLVLENDQNSAKLLAREGDGQPRFYTAQWNDDYHHVMHALLTGEEDGYYEDYAEDRPDKIGKALSSGFIYQGEVSRYRDGKRRGEASAHLPPLAFVNFIQNHDQIGNRPYGERLARIVEDPARIEAALCLLLLAPQVPLLYMGEEWGESRPFCFFCDFHDELADVVREGRRNEFSRFKEFQTPEARESIPDPNATTTFEASKLDWSKVAAEGPYQARLDLVRLVLAIRAQEIVPIAQKIGANAGERSVESGVLRAEWEAGNCRLRVIANLRDEAASRTDISGRIIHAYPANAGVDGVLPAWSVIWSVTEGGRHDRP